MKRLADLSMIKSLVTAGIYLFVFFAMPAVTFAVAKFPFRSNVFIKDWLICGPFPNEENQNIHTDFLVEHGGEAGIFPNLSLHHSSASVPEGKVSWLLIKADDTGKLDFCQHVCPNQKNIAYVAAIITCKQEIQALLKTGSNDRLKVWLNGKLIYFYPEPRAGEPDADLNRVVLREGENLLLAKVDQTGGNWWLYARLEELVFIDEDVYVLEPIISPVWKRISPRLAVDIFSLPVFNTSHHPIGPLFLEVLPGADRSSASITCPIIQPGQSEWLVVESTVDLTKSGNKVLAELELTCGPAQKKFTVKAERSALPDYPDLEIYIVPHSHADLSWPDTPEICTNLNCQAIELSIDILAQRPEFKFSEEDVFVLQEFLRRNPQRTEEVRDLLQRNILECGGFYFGPSELLLGGEGLIRNLYFGKLWLLNTFGIDTAIAWNVDEPGHTWQLPQILAKAGINSFIIWKVLLRPENNLNVTGYVGPTIFRWQAADGSEVLVTSCPESYGAGHLLRTDNFLTAAKKLQRFVQREIGHNKDWDLPPVILMADGSDCAIPDPRVGKNAELWNQRYGYPQLKLASVKEYFDAVEKAVQKGEGKIPTVAGEMPCWWDGTQSVENDAFLLTRHAESFVTTAEKFSAINDLLFADYEYPQAAINDVWQGKLWVHEHNWGGTNGAISDAIKLARAREAYRLADDLRTSVLNRLTADIRCKKMGIPLIVFNSLAWARFDIVDYVITVEEKSISEFHLLTSSGTEVPVQIKILARHADGSIARAQVIFEAEVPSLGYATYYLAAGANRTKKQVVASDSTLENQFFKIAIDAASGGISSIFDKQNNYEILNTIKYKGNELIALKNLGVDESEEFTDECWRMGEKPASVKLIESGPIRATIQVEGYLLTSRRIQEISLYANLARIDFKTILNWDGQKQIQVNAIFPISLKKAQLSYEVPFGVVEYGKESPAAKACHPTVRATNNWIDLSNQKMGITLATEVTPFDVKDRLDPRFHDARTMTGEIDPDYFFMCFGGEYQTFKRIALQDPMLLETAFVIQPILLRSVFSCGDPNLYFTQKGEHVYRFSIGTHEGDLLVHEAARFGWELQTPLVVCQGQSTSGDLQDSQSFLQISAPNVIATILKKAEDGKGVILRCYETNGKDSQVTVDFFKSICSAEHTDILEQHGKNVILEKGRLQFEIGHHAIETYKLKVDNLRR